VEFARRTGRRWYRLQTDQIATAYGPREEERLVDVVVLISNLAVIFYFTKGN
jgi:hypothetical protein